MREDEIRKFGYKVVTTTLCVWQQNASSKIPYEGCPVICTYPDIVEAVRSDDIFGFVELDVLDELKDKFSEFPPIFKNFWQRNRNFDGIAEKLP